MNYDFDFNGRVLEKYEELEDEAAERYIRAVDYNVNSDYAFFAEEIKKKYGLENKKVLEIGSGPGLLCVELARRKAKRVVGVDGSKTMTKYANLVLKREKKFRNIVFYRYSVNDIPFMDNSFDIVVTQNSFHHFVNPENALKEMLRLVKHGGVIYIADYRRDSNKDIIKKRVIGTKPEIRTDFYNTIRASFTKKEFAEILAKMKINTKYKVSNAKNPFNIYRRALYHIIKDPIPHYKDYEIALRAEVRKI